MAELGFLSFEELLAQFFDRPEVEGELLRRYRTRAAVLVVDFTAMAKRTDDRGIVYALAMARAAERAMAGAFESHEGTQVKRVADTLFVVFPSAGHALNAALDAQRRLDVHNAGRHDHIRGCFGLGFGDVLLVPAVDVYGPEVNRAFVLGEDVAKGGEVLVTEAFLTALGGLPPGVGAHRGPADREEDAGFAFHVVADYR
ncbi:MAG: hypothetical protein ACOZNI_21330 [Myxococcota bacterium]